MWLCSAMAAQKPCWLRWAVWKRPCWSRLTVVPKRTAGKQVAIGAEVTVTVGPLRMIHPVHAVSGYLSSGDPRAHFGLGAAEKADLVEIRWPDGELQRLEDVEANQILEVTRVAE